MATQGAFAKKFQQASQCVNQVGLSDMANYSQDGRHHDAVTPFKLFLVPGKGVQTPDKQKTADEANAEMAAFPVGSVLYTVFACANASLSEMTPTAGGLEAACEGALELGDMATTTKCTPSLYGDEHLFFQHQRIEEDWQLRPEFLTQYDAAKACGWSGKISADGAPRKCPKY
jgi:hypothetical protein